MNDDVRERLQRLAERRDDAGKFLFGGLQALCPCERAMKLELTCRECRTMYSRMVDGEATEWHGEGCFHCAGRGYVLPDSPDECAGALRRGMAKQGCQVLAVYCKGGIPGIEVSITQVQADVYADKHPYYLCLAFKRNDDEDAEAELQSTLEAVEQALGATQEAPHE